MNLVNGRMLRRARCEPVMALEVGKRVVVLDVVAVVAADIPGVGQALEVAPPREPAVSKLACQKRAAIAAACSHPSYTPG